MKIEPLTMDSPKEDSVAFLNKIPVLETSIAGMSDVLDTLGSKIDALGKTKEVTATVSEETARLEQNVVAGITKFDVAGFPLGQVVVGGASAIFVTELVDGFMAKMGQGTTVNGLVKIGAAVGVIRYGKKLLGKEGAFAAALLIGFDAVRDLVPLDTMIQSLTSKISGVTASRGLASNSRYNVVTEAKQVASDYYARAGV